MHSSKHYESVDAFVTLEDNMMYIIIVCCCTPIKYVFTSFWDIIIVQTLRYNLCCKSRKQSPVKHHVMYFWSLFRRSQPYQGKMSTPVLYQVSHLISINREEPSLIYTHVTLTQVCMRKREKEERQIAIEDFLLLRLFL